MKASRSKDAKQDELMTELGRFMRLTRNTVKHVDRIFISPDGPLHFVPLSQLMDGSLRLPSRKPRVS